MKKFLFLLFPCLLFAQAPPPNAVRVQGNLWPVTSNLYDVGYTYCRYDSSFVRYGMFNTVNATGVITASGGSSSLWNLAYAKSITDSVQYVMRYGNQNVTGVKSFLDSISIGVAGSSIWSPVIFQDGGSVFHGSLSTNPFLSLSANVIWYLPTISGIIPVKSDVLKNADSTKLKNSIFATLDTPTIAMKNQPNIFTQTNMFTQPLISDARYNFNSGTGGTFGANAYASNMTGSGHYINGYYSSAYGLNDSIYTTSSAGENYIWGKYNTIGLTNPTGAHGNWLFGQYLRSENYGVWALGADDTFGKKIIPFHGAIVFVNEQFVHWLSNVFPMNRENYFGWQSPRVKDSVKYEFTYKKLGSENDDLAHASFNLQSRRNFVGATQSLIDVLQGDYLRYLSINTNDDDAIHWNDYKTSTRAFGGMYLDSADFTVSNGDLLIPNGGILSGFIGGSFGAINIGSNSLTAGAGTFSVSSFIHSNDNQAVPNQLTISGTTNTNQQLMIGYNTTLDYGSIQSIKQGDDVKSLILQPLGGRTIFGSTGTFRDSVTISHTSSAELHLENTSGKRWKLFSYNDNKFYLGVHGSANAISIDGTTFATTILGALNVTGVGTFNDNVIVNKNNGYLALNRAAVTNYLGISYQTATAGQWFVGLRENLSSNNYIIYNEGTGHDAVTVNKSTDAMTLYSTLGIAGATVDSSLTALGGHFRGLKVDANVDVDGAITADGDITGGVIVSNGGSIQVQGTYSNVDITAQDDDPSFDIQVSGDEVFLFRPSAGFVLQQRGLGVYFQADSIVGITSPLTYSYEVGDNPVPVWIDENGVLGTYPTSGTVTINADSLITTGGIDAGGVIEVRGTGTSSVAGRLNVDSLVSTKGAAFGGLVSGTFYTWSQAAYGGAFISDDHPDTIAFSGANEVHTVGSRQLTAPIGYPLTSGGVLKNITVQDSSMTVSITGKYDVAWSISLASGSGVAPNAKFNAYIYVNDAKQEKTGAMCKLAGGSEVENLPGTAMTISLTANDIVKLKLINVDDANGNQVVVLYAKFHLTRIE